LKSARDKNMDSLLESAVVSSWADLAHTTENLSIHIEYDFTQSGTLDHLQVWSSQTRGCWSLVCTYWMSASELHSEGLQFENGYKSERLASTLELLMQHQYAFAPPPNLGRQGLLQLSNPTPRECQTAASLVQEAFDCVNLASKEMVAC